MGSHPPIVTLVSEVSAIGLVLCILFAFADWPKLGVSSTRLGNSPWLPVAYLFLLTHTTLEFCTSSDKDVVNLDAIIIVVLLVTIPVMFIREWKKTH